MTSVGEFGLLRGPRVLVLMGLVGTIGSVGCAADEVDTPDSAQTEAALAGGATPGSVRWSKTFTPNYPRHGSDVHWSAVPKSVFADDNGLISVLVEEVDDRGSSQSELFRLKPSGEVLRAKTFRSTPSSSRTPTAAFLRADGSIVISTLAAPAPGTVFAIAPDDRILWTYRDLENHATEIIAVDASGNPILSSSTSGYETVKLDGATGKESWRVKMPCGKGAGAGTTDANGAMWLVIGGGVPGQQPRWDLSRIDDSGAFVETIPDFSRGRGTVPQVSGFGSSFLVLEAPSRTELRLPDHDSPNYLNLGVEAIDPRVVAHPLPLASAETRPDGSEMASVWAMRGNDACKVQVSVHRYRASVSTAALRSAALTWT